MTTARAGSRRHAEIGRLVHDPEVVRDPPKEKSDVGFGVQVKCEVSCKSSAVSWWDLLLGSTLRS